MGTNTTNNKPKYQFLTFTSYTSYKPPHAFVIAGNIKMVVVSSSTSGSRKFSRRQHRRRCCCLKRRNKTISMSPSSIAFNAVITIIIATQTSTAHDVSAASSAATDVTDFPTDSFTSPRLDSRDSSLEFLRNKYSRRDNLERTQQQRQKQRETVAFHNNDGNVCIDTAEMYAQTGRLSNVPFQTILETIGAIAQAILIKGEMTTRKFMPLFPDPAWSDLYSMSYMFDGSWTNWYSDPSLMGGLGKIITAREIIDTATVDPYTSDEVAAMDADIVCDESTVTARTADGTCNDRTSPSMGAANTRFGRNMKRSSINTDMLLTPNPREVSKLYRVKEGSNRTMAPILNILSVGWIQFVVHDWNHHTTDLSLENAVEIPLTRDDVTTSFINENTHWWDGSQIYGNDQETQNRLRSMVDGKLLVETDSNSKTRLPTALDGQQSDAAFTTNWWLGLEVMHTVFVLEHNSICDMLIQNNPDWDDQRLFDVSRLITSYLIARIHSREWTVAILPSSYSEFGQAVVWEGLNKYMTNTFFGSVLGLVGGQRLRGILQGSPSAPTDLAGHPYALTEEFVTVYRLHSLLPDQLEFVNATTGSSITVPTGDTAKNGQSRSLAEALGMENIVRGMGKQMATATTLHNAPTFLSDMETPHGIVDLPTTDVYRDRERGVPRYQEFRRRIGLKAVESFIDLTNGDEELANEISEVYDGDLELLDLQIGMLAEGVRPLCFGFGETAFQIFVQIAGFRLQKDRFFHEEFRPDVYTQEGMDWVLNTSFKDVLLRHFPELESDLANTENAFAPWTPPN